jgi:zinc/manganese transport system ATP-binding protein
VTALAFNDVTIKLGGREILSSASFAIEEGEFVGMLGSNGAGKTTLMRAALGLAPVAAGTIAIFGAPVRRGHRAIGYMPQNRGAIAGLRFRVRDVVRVAASGAHFGLTPLDTTASREIDWALDQVGALSLADRSIGELSGGERQRVLLSQALLGRPKLILLDEPLISLDPAHQVIVIDIAKRLSVELKIAVVFSAHELNPLVNSIDRVLYLGRGQAVIGSVDQVITGPVLSKLYGSEIEVLRASGRVFVLAGGVEVESGAHRHEDHDHEHDHGHDHAHGGDADA